MLGLVVVAIGEVGVVVKGAAANIRVVTVGQKLLDFPVVGSLADGEFEIFLSDRVPELRAS